MRLNVDFRALEETARRMGAAVPEARVIDVRRGTAPVDPIDIELGNGKKLRDLSGVRSDPEFGLLSYEGRQVVLYIQDQGWNIHAVLADGSKGKKVHVADCDTLQEMRRQRRYERYVATNDVSGDFYVTGQDEYRRSVEGQAKLRVCKNCLRKLDYMGYTRNREQVFKAFEWSELFDTYRSHFTQMPTRRAGVFDGSYAPGWNLAARGYKEAHDFVCENCRVNLRECRRLLHVHHLNGVKTDNVWSNLKALCANCHVEQPGHEHMRVSTEDANLIADMRRRQSLL